MSPTAAGLAAALHLLTALALWWVSPLKQIDIPDAPIEVTMEEPPKPDHPLLSLPNVTLTPHSAGPTWENWTARFRNGFDNIQRVAAGRSPKWVIPELLTPPGV